MSPAEDPAEARYLDELARVDREWEAEKERYLVVTNYGRRVPAGAMGVGLAAGSAVGGAALTLYAVSLLRGRGDFAPFAVAAVLCPAVVVLLTLAAVGYGLYCVRRAVAYNKALAAYLARREAVSPDDFR